MLDLYNLVVLIARKETESIFNAHVASISGSLGKPVTININFDAFTLFKEFKVNLVPDVQTKIVKTLNTTLLEGLFLGPYG